jgi:hypothetical protein
MVSRLGLEAADWLIPADPAFNAGEDDQISGTYRSMLQQIQNCPTFSLFISGISGSLKWEWNSIKARPPAWRTRKDHRHQASHAIQWNVFHTSFPSRLSPSEPCSSLGFPSISDLDMPRRNAPAPNRAFRFSWYPKSLFLLQGSRGKSRSPASRNSQRGGGQAARYSISKGGQSLAKYP